MKKTEKTLKQRLAEYQLREKQREQQLESEEIEAFFKKNPGKSNESIPTVESAPAEDSGSNVDEDTVRQAPLVEAQITEWCTEKYQYIWHLKLVSTCSAHKKQKTCFFWVCVNPSDDWEQIEDGFNWNRQLPYDDEFDALRWLKSFFHNGLPKGWGGRREGKFSKLSVQFSSTRRPKK